MTNDDILSMAKKSGIVTERNTEHLTVDGLERFAALVAAAEREVCAEICAEIAGKQQTLGRRFAASECYSATHARGQK